MDLLNRYLQAVKFWLPNAQKADIIAELSEDLHSQIDEREAALGRPVTEAELEALLRHVGRPVLVANRYLPQRHLIGPVLFPIYTFVLKSVALCYLVPSTLVWASLIVLDPKYRGDIGQAWGSFWLAAFTAIGAVTVVFAVLEYVQAKSAFLERWDPAKLPAVRDTRRIPRGASTLEIVANTVFCGWWVAAMRSPLIVNLPTLQVSFAPIWTVFFWSLLIVAIANIALAAVNLLRPYWTTRRAVMRLLSNLTSSGLFVGLFRSHLIASIVVPGVSAARTIEIATTINRVMSEMWLAVLIVAAVVLAVDIQRIIRASGADRQLNGGSTRVGLNNSAAR
jgi:hypothetical protein